jgi:hypothetical protein
VAQVTIENPILNSAFDAPARHFRFDNDADDSMTGETPTYRNIWLRIRDDLPKKGRKAEALVGEPKLPAELQGALHSLYGHYEKAFLRWEARADARPRGQTPRSLWSSAATADAMTLA